MSRPSIIFFGTPVFAANILRYLVENHVSIRAVVTQPDRPKGRSLKMSFSAVKEVVLEKLPHIPLFQPEKASNPEFLSEIAKIEADLFVVVAFGQILPQKLLDIPPLGAINVHASLLPKYRGAAPIHRCLMNGDRETGVSIQKMVKQLDAGDVIAESKIAISSELNCGELESLLCELSKPLLHRIIESYQEGVPSAVKQDEALVTFAPKVDPEEGKIDWNRPAIVLHNLIRAFSPRPGAWAEVRIGSEAKRVKILRAKVDFLQGAPGVVLTTKSATVGCKDNSLTLLEVQPEGKARMAAVDWLRGLKEIPKF